MAITPLPTPVPSRADPSTFSARADAFLTALPDFATEANDLAVEVNADAVSAAESASTATTQASTATTQSGIATSAASQALASETAAELAASLAAASESAAAGFANEAMVIGLDVESLKPSVKPTLLLDFLNSSVVAPSVSVSRSSAAWFTDLKGSIREAGINVPRIDYDPLTLESKGLLCEEQRSNLLLNSVFAGAVSGTPGTPPTSWSLVVANGTTTFLSGQSRFVGGNKIQLSAVTNRQYLSQSFSVTSGLVYNFSCEFEVLSGTCNLENLFIGIASGGSVFTSQYYLDGVLSAGTVVPSVGKHTYRVAYTVTTSGQIQQRLGIGVLGTPTGDVIFDLPQSEQGTVNTSYIPTTTTTVTRAADVISITDITPWFTSTEGTLFADSSTSRSSLGFSFQIDDGTADNRITLNVAQNRGDSLVSGVNVAPLIGTSQSINTRLKCAYAFKVNDYAYSFNGSAPIFDTSGAVPQGLTTARIGRDNSTGYINGHIRQIKFFPKRLSNAEIQSLTTM